jgi:hypothetical protein
VSVHIYSAPTAQILVKFDVRNSHYILSTKSKFWWQSETMGTLHENTNIVTPLTATYEAQKYRGNKILFFHRNSVWSKAPQYCVIRTLSILCTEALRFTCNITKCPRLNNLVWAALRYGISAQLGGVK